MKKSLFITSTLILGATLFGTISANASPLRASNVNVNTKYDVLFLKDSAFDYQIISGATLDDNNNASVNSGTTIKFKVNLKNGYYESYTYAVKANSNTLSKDNNSCYTVKINANTTISVDGVSSSLPEYRLSMNLADGVEVNITNKEKNFDGSFTLNQGDFSFQISFEKSFVPTDDFNVALNGVSLESIGDYIYNATILSNSVLTVSGVEFKAISVSMKDTELYTFSNINGVNLRNGIGTTYANETITFKVNKTLIATGSLVVKNGSTVLNPVNGVYTVKSTEDIEIKVEGLTKDGEILAEKSFDVIPSYQYDCHEIKNSINKEGGFTKSYIYSGQWNSKPQLLLNSTAKFEEFDLVMFSVYCVGGGYFEITPTNGSVINSIHNEAWTNIYIQKETDPIKYRIYVGSLDNTGKTTCYMNSTDKLSDFKVKIQASYYISELQANRNPNYVDPHHTLDFAPILGAVASGDFFTLNSSYGKKQYFASIDPNQYKSLEMTISFSEVGYYNIGIGISDVKFGITANTEYKIIITKVSSGVFNVTFGTKDFGNLSIGDDLSSLIIMFQNKSGGVNTATMTKFLVEDDEPMQSMKSVIFDGTGENYSFEIENHNAKIFAVETGSTLSFVVTPDSGYEVTVKANNNVISGVNNSYELTINENTTISISASLTATLKWSVISQKTLGDTTGWADGGTPDYVFEECSTKKAIRKPSALTIPDSTPFTLENVDLTGYQKLVFFMKESGSQNVYFKFTNNNSGTPLSTGQISLSNDKLWHQITLELQQDKTWKVILNDDTDNKWNNSSLGLFDNLSDIDLYLWNYRSYYISCMYGAKYSN